MTDTINDDATLSGVAYLADEPPHPVGVRRRFAGTGKSPGYSVEIVLFTAMVLVIIVSAFLVGQRDGVRAGKEVVCNETEWKSPICKVELYRREFLKDPPGSGTGN